MFMDIDQTREVQEDDENGIGELEVGCSTVDVARLGAVEE